MSIPNDYTRCTGTDCERAKNCERFTSRPEGVNLSMHDAKDGCVGFVGKYIHAYPPQPKKEKK